MITRKRMEEKHRKKWLMLVISMCMMLSIVSPVSAYKAQLKPFKDEEYDYSREPIYMLAALNIIDGYEDGTFQPNAPLSREAFIKLLVAADQLQNKVKVKKLPIDVKSQKWSAPYISYAMEQNWLINLLNSKNQLQPTTTITRQEVAALVGRAMLEQESEATRKRWVSDDWKRARDKSSFKDQLKIKEELRPYVYYAVHRGVMEGSSGGFQPQASLIRKQASAVVYRYLDQLIVGKKIELTGYYAISSYSAKQHIDKLSTVIFGWSQLEYDKEGSAKLSTTKSTFRIPDGFDEVVQLADKQKASKELMVFYDGSNLPQFLKDKPAQTAFIDSLLTVLNNKKYGFTGVHIDFEGLKAASSAPDYVQFLESLRKKLTGLTLSVAVPPTFFYKGYDLQKIGKIVDTVNLMAHDFTEKSSKQPSAPLPLVHAALVDALAVVPKEKLVLAISKQANQWVTKSKDGIEEVSLYSPTIADVEKRLTMAAVTGTWSMPYFLWKATFTDESGQHEMYYEDAQSIAKKIWLARLYDIKGVSLWHMGNFTAQDWRMISW
ncbi:glycosyl hydrolase family 18 protein [Paenibacillus yanchengensis]|uniref:Glycosyl hydrolase family 18 protein n=1 Tax=Paenibacillus yanchengensis TaxID=2035833 RepID=A0ABW4YNE7_9BACL